MSLVKVKNHLDKFLPLYVPIAMLIGFYIGLHINVPAHKGTFKVLNLIVVISMIYPMMINLRISELKKSARMWKPITVGLMMGLVVAPLLMFLLIKLTSLFLPLTPEISLGLLLAVVVPCSSMTIAYTGFAGGNLELATILVALSFTLAIGVVPLWLKIFATTAQLSISSWLLVKTIIIVVMIPMVLGISTRYILLKKLGSEKFLKIKPLFSTISLIGLYVIVALIFMEKAQLIYSKPFVVLTVLVPLLMYYALSLLFLTFFDKFIKIPYKDHMAITFTSVGKNEGTAMAIALTAGMGVTAIPPAVTPIFQIVMLVTYVKLANVIKRYYGEDTAIQ